MAGNIAVQLRLHDTANLVNDSGQVGFASAEKLWIIMPEAPTKQHTHVILEVFKHFHRHLQLSKSSSGLGVAICGLLI